MKRLLLLLFFIPFISLAQVPQGVDYQAVATDINGDELVNQSISIRASVLSGSATGTVEWEETHATSTDTFGLFTLTIGQGINTTNGAQASFADISWGTNTHYLKIEMDVTGGSNYSFMGTNQMMSVPYALYAESANINYDSISNLLSNDSTFITTVGGGIGGGGCDFNFPDGYNGVPVIHDFVNDGSYTVPPGKNLYTNMIAHNTSDDIFINSKKIWNSGNMYSEINIVLSEGDIISMGTALSTTKLMFGLLVDKKVQSLSYDFLSSGAYTVPAGKNLYIYRVYHNALYIEVNSKAIATDPVVTNDGFYPHHLILKSGDIIDVIDQGSGGFEYMFGYLADENYFAGCGGGGGSSSATSSLDSTTIANMIAGAGGGCNFKYPDGLDGTPITYQILSSSSYTVPTGKTLYITSLSTPASATHMKLNGGYSVFTNYNASTNNAKSFSSLPSPLIFKENDELSVYPSTADIKINGFLVDQNVDPISPNLFSSNYTVPTGKILYVTSLFTPASSTHMRLNGSSVFTNYNASTNNAKSFSSLPSPLIFKENDELSVYPSTADVKINGYLVDENYFAGCGGGGSSSASSGTMSVSTFGDTLYVNGQAIIIPGLSYTNVVPTFGSVTDTSGNTYPTIDYGPVGEWMTENLMTTNYSNGDPINVHNFHQNQGNFNSPSYYNLFTSNVGYGYVYNGYAVLDGRNVCPSGWHVPSGQEYEDLFLIFGSKTNDEPYGNNSNFHQDEYTPSGAALKDDLNWSANDHETNYSHMSVFPTGYTWYMNGNNTGPGGITSQGLEAVLWTTSEGGNNWQNNLAVTLFYNHTKAIFDLTGKSELRSVRCKKD